MLAHQKPTFVTETSQAFIPRLRWRPSGSGAVCLLRHEAAGNSTALLLPTCHKNADVSTGSEPALPAHPAEACEGRQCPQQVSLECGHESWFFGGESSASNDVTLPAKLSGLEGELLYVPPVCSDTKSSWKMA